MFSLRFVCCLVDQSWSLCLNLQGVPMKRRFALIAAAAALALSVAVSVASAPQTSTSAGSSASKGSASRVFMGRSWG